MASSTVPEPDYSYLGLILSTGDPRTRDWPMMGSPVIVVSILASYLYFCTSLGPRLMKNREAFNIRPIVLAYNVIMVGLSLFFCVLTLKLTYVGQEIGPYNVVCEATSTTDSVLLYWGWWYMLTKIALPSSVKPNLWWKKYVTQFQIAQFFALMVHGLMPFIFDCGFPKTMASLMVLEAGLFTCLFSDFYYKNYIKGQDERYIIGSSTKSD
ncbi:elongation of very long chain fatty acids protein AAEL008004-like isoform X2 [Varroa jacobsoni]|uniref:Elongation of very long chain fatty acids protein n=1 Tax=Varroa destructor TaxID=109461 RepID=A0A7M7JK12_VARDE|nr:elongation of very long chain fatty acids protein AAEL008004-like isoform X2 [Varroa destructor]XP_022699288.1 elongation of very long chain fatty acids protein AAEL008004-like isoform X2 [Varroa jacobsoni]